MPPTRLAGVTLTQGLRRIAHTSARFPLETVAFSVLLSVTAYLALVHYFARISVRPATHVQASNLMASATPSFAENSRLTMAFSDGRHEVIRLDDDATASAKEALMVTIATSDEGYTDLVSRILTSRVAVKDAFGHILTLDKLCIAKDGKCVTFSGRSEDAADDASRFAFSWILDTSTSDQLSLALQWQAKLLSTFVPGMKSRSTGVVDGARGRSHGIMAEGLHELKESWQNSENVDVVVVVIGWILMFGTFANVFLKMREAVGSKFTLGFAVLISSSCALNLALVLARILRASFTLAQLSEALPFFVVAVSFDRHVTLARSVVSFGQKATEGSRRLSIREKVIGGVEESGPRIAKEYAVILGFLFCGSISGVAGLNDFCLLAFLVVAFDALLLFTLFTSIVTLKLELNRIRESNAAAAEPTVERPQTWRGAMTRMSKLLCADFSVTKWLESPLLGKIKLVMILGFLVVHALNASAGLPLMSFDDPAQQLAVPYTTSLPEAKQVLDFLGEDRTLRVGKKVVFESLKPTDSIGDVPFTSGESGWSSIVAALAVVGWGMYMSTAGIRFPGFSTKERTKSAQGKQDSNASPLPAVAPLLEVVKDSARFASSTEPRVTPSKPAEPAKDTLKPHVDFSAGASEPKVYTTRARRQSIRPEPSSRRGSIRPDHGLRSDATPQLRRASMKVEGSLSHGAPNSDHPPVRPTDMCLAVVKAEGPFSITDEEVIQLVDHGHVKEYALEKWCQDPVRGVKIRRMLVGRTISKQNAAQQLPYHHYDYAGVVGQCCENVVGYVPIPVGVAGPFVVDGKVYQIPMATTEGALVASTSRGCKAISACGGAQTALTADGMTRGPVVEFPSSMKAAEARKWAESEAGFKHLKAAFESTTRFGKLNKLKMANAGRLLFIRFSTFTGDAMGMNMISKGCEKALEEMAILFPEMRVVSLSGNYCTDKKPAAINWIEGRGKSVLAEAVISGKVVQSVLKTTVQAIVHLNTTKNLIGSAMAGSVGGFNAHAANILTAIYLATGQDPAQNVESSQCMTLMEAVNDGQDLHVSVTMPCIEVGTVGGGTTLAPQAACLDLLGVRGPNQEQPGRNSQQLARLIAASVMAGELSLCAALAAGHLVKSHMAHNRAPPAAAPLRVSAAIAAAPAGQTAEPTKQAAMVVPAVTVTGTSLSVPAATQEGAAPPAQ